MLFRKPQEHTEKFIRDQTTAFYRLLLLIALLSVIIFVLYLSYSVSIRSDKYDKFNEISYFVVSAVLSIISSIISFFFGLQAGEKSKPIEIPKESDNK